MKADLELLTTRWSQKGSPLGNVLLEGEIDQKLLELFDPEEGYFQNTSPEYKIRILPNTLIVTEKSSQTMLFTQSYKKESNTHKTTRREVTLENQKHLIDLDESRKNLYKYLEERDWDWMYPILLRPQPCNCTDFARLFGYNSFFYRWFEQIPKKKSNHNLDSWKKYFQEIYHDNSIKSGLYWTHYYIILVCSQIITILYENMQALDLNLNPLFPLLTMLKMQFFSESELEHEELFKNALKKALIVTLLHHPPKNSEDILNIFYQELVTFSRRHTLGEFFTNRELCREMVAIGFSPGDSVLDPCCGSGTFLVEIFCVLEKSADNPDYTHLYGMDIHPISVIITKINLLIAFWRAQKRKSQISTQNSKILDKILSNITQGDYLFDESCQHFDLIIGNPPWIVINSINSDTYKTKLKHLARSLRISTDTQNMSNLEVSSLFLEKTTSFHMKKGSKLFLIVSAGILTGSQNERVRRFTNLTHINVWTFTRDLFNVHNICILAEFGEESFQNKYRIRVQKKILTQKSIFITKQTQIYVPVYIRAESKFYALQDLTKEPDCEEWGIGRFIPVEKRTLSVKKSEYHDKFRQGACIGPRNLLFVCATTELNKSSRLCSITPDPLIKSKKYGGWNYSAYSCATIEKKYLHSIAKSTELIPFFLLRTNTAFLPFPQNPSKESYLNAQKKPLSKYDIERIFGEDTHAKVHYAFLHSLYAKNIKSGGAIPDLFLNMNYNNKLLHQKQYCMKKVIYNGIGSKVKAAYIQNGDIIDSSLYYYIPKSDMEAYYLVGILNSPTITYFTTHMGSTGAGGSLRNIHKNPLKCNILTYTETPTQKMVAKLGHSLETYVQSYCVNQIYSQFISDIQKECCEICGAFISSSSMNTHQTHCKGPIEFGEFQQMLKSLSASDREILSDKDVVIALLLNKPIDIQQNIREKAKSLLNLSIKPKTLHNRLRKDELFQKKIHVLDMAVKSLWK